MVIAFIGLQSEHKQKFPSGLGTSITGTTQGIKLSRTWPLSISCCTCRSISFVSSGLTRYGALFGSGAPGMRSIRCSMPHRGGRPGGSSSGKTSWNSCKREDNTKGRLWEVLVFGASSLHTRTKCITLDGFSHTSLISLFVANRTRFFSLGEEALKFGLWLSLTFWWITFSLFSPWWVAYLSAITCLGDIGRSTYSIPFILKL